MTTKTYTIEQEVALRGYVIARTRRDEFFAMNFYKHPYAHDSYQIIVTACYNYCIKLGLDYDQIVDYVRDQECI